MYTVNSENKECNAMLPKYCSSKLAASLPVLKSQMFFKDILHLISSRSVCKSLKLLLSSEISNRSFGPPVNYDGPIFVGTNSIKSNKQRLFSNKSSVLCVASAGREISNQFELRKEIWPTIYEWIRLVFDYWFSFFLSFIRLPVYLQVFCTVNLIACFQFFLCNLY